MRLRLCAVGRDGAPLFTGCASTYGVQYTVAAWSFLVLHDTVSVAFTASHTSREFIVWRERTTLDWDGSPCVGGLPRPTARTAKSVLQRPNASVARGRGPKTVLLYLAIWRKPSPAGSSSCAVVVDRVSSLIRVHTTIHSSESHRVSATTRPAQPNSSAIRARRMRCSQIQSHLTAE